MQISKHTKLMLLFISLQNPLWNELLSPGNRNTDRIIKMTKIGHGSVPTWKRGGPIQPSTAEKIFTNTKERIFHPTKIDLESGSALDPARAAELAAMIDAFREAYHNNRLSLYDAAAVLSMSIDDCQKIIDEVIYSRFSLFPSLLYDPASADAEDDFKRYRGVYTLSIKRGSVWLLCPLRVRYLLRIGDGLGLRCKLNAPIITPDSDQTYWEYDGFLTAKNNRIFWIFEKRQTRRADFFHFITCTGRPFRSRFTLSGTYLTTGQDMAQSIVTGDLIMQRIACQSPQDIKAAMHSGIAATDDEATCASFDSLLSDFRKGRYPER